ncbi:MAG: histidinol dehydrogenase [Rikenellaceae bacterium]|nr:histidinol dehydrogenase [Rikenellaceae bacterium]
MEIIFNPPRGEWEKYFSRAGHDDQTIAAAVARIVARVREEDDDALTALAESIDGVKLDYIEVPQAVMRQAAAKVSAELKGYLETAAGNIRRFHEAQRSATIDMETMPGVRCVRRVVAIDRVGIYVPGGTAPLVSTVLMLGIPARIAGCRETILCTPPSRGGTVVPEIAYAANLCGIERIFLAGGAQAIAAMAYGTRTVPKVDKIFGPGNRYVTKAKQLLSVSEVAIDMPAGPSEVMILADGTAVPEFTAADMLSQAEHGPDSQAMLVCNSLAFAEQVRRQVDKQLENLPRREQAAASVARSRILVMDNVDEMIDLANGYAAEHLIICMEEAWEVARRITCAGSIFIGNYSPESAGDYTSGTNHTLPTSGWARAYSGVNLDSFTKKITLQELTPEGLAALAPAVAGIARAEGLEGHARAVEVRMAAISPRTTE